MATGDSKLANPFAGPSWAAFVTRQSDPPLAEAFLLLLDLARSRPGAKTSPTWRDLHALLEDDEPRATLRAKASPDIYDRVLHIVERGASFETRRKSAG